MAEYIEREAAELAAIDGADRWDGGENYERDLAIQEAIRRIPAADVAEVVRCGECVHRTDPKRFSCQGRSKNWFCADGERRAE